MTSLAHLARLPSLLPYFDVLRFLNSVALPRSECIMSVLCRERFLVQNHTNVFLMHDCTVGYFDVI